MITRSLRGRGWSTLLLATLPLITQALTSPTSDLSLSLHRRQSDTIDSYCKPPDRDDLKWYQPSHTSLNISDCESALLQLKNGEAYQYGHRNLYFSDVHSHGFPGEQVPKRYEGEARQCVLYIIMRHYFRYVDRQFESASPQGMELVDLTSYKALAKEAEKLYVDCVRDGGGRNAEGKFFEGRAGWKPAGMKHSMAVIFWGSHSQRDNYEGFASRERLVVGPVRGSVE